MSAYDTQSTEEFEGLIRRKVRRHVDADNTALRYRTLAKVGRDKDALRNAIDRALERVDLDRNRVECVAPDTERVESLMTGGSEASPRSDAKRPTTIVVFLEAEEPRFSAKIFAQGAGSAIDIFGLGRFGPFAGGSYAVDDYLSHRPGALVDSLALMKDWLAVGCDIEASIVNEQARVDRSEDDDEGGRAQGRSKTRRTRPKSPLAR